MKLKFKKVIEYLSEELQNDDEEDFVLIEYKVLLFTHKVISIIYMILHKSTKVIKAPTRIK